MRRLHAEGWSRFLPRLIAVVAGRDPGEDPARDVGWWQAGLPAVLDLAYPAGWRLRYAATAGADYRAALSLDPWW